MTTIAAAAGNSGSLAPGGGKRRGIRVMSELPGAKASLSADFAWTHEI